MIKQIKDNAKLGEYCTNIISDEGIEVGIDENLATDDFIGIKADGYYNPKIMKKDCPKMVDFVVTVDCECNSYKLYVLEMKSSTIDNVAINEKFKNALEILMSRDFKDIFLNDKYKYKDIKLYLISKTQASALKYKNYAEYVRIYNIVKNKDTLQKDIYASEKIFHFRKRILRMEKELPGRIIIQK